MPTWDVSFGLRVNFADRELQTLLAEVHAEARLTAAIPLPPSARKKLDALHIVRAVRGTTGIEGAAVTEEEVSQILNAPAGQSVLPPARAREEMEVRNAETVMRFVASTGVAPVTEDLVRHIHDLVTRGIAYEHNEPGVYRSHPVQAGSYIPPRTKDEISRLMAQFIEWMNSREVRSWDPVVQAVAAHFYLISIHPFGDGNGRTSRALESLVLYRGGINVLGFYSLSNFYYQNRAEYVEMLDRVRFHSKGDLTPFVLFAVRGLRSEVKAVGASAAEAIRIISFRDYARDQLLGLDGVGGKVGSRLFTLLNAMIDYPEFTSSPAAKAVYSVAAYRGLSPRTAQRDLATLMLLQLVHMKDGRIQPNLDLMDEFMPGQSSKI